MDLTSRHIVRSLRPPRRRGFPADLALGFYLYAPERLTYLNIRRGADPSGWRTHRFITFDGRLIGVKLPPKGKLFLWPVGHGPRPQDSIASRASVWGRIPPMTLAALSSRELGRLYALWHRYGTPKSDRA